MSLTWHFSSMCLTCSFNSLSPVRASASRSLQLISSVCRYFTLSSFPRSVLLYNTAEKWDVRNTGHKKILDSNKGEHRIAWNRKTFTSSICEILVCISFKVLYDLVVLSRMLSSCLFSCDTSFSEHLWEGMNGQTCTMMGGSRLIFSLVANTHFFQHVKPLL